MASELKPTQWQYWTEGRYWKDCTKEYAESLAKINVDVREIATRPAPAATDTGLVTVGTEHGLFGNHGKREVVWRSRAEELLVAKEAECAKYRNYAAEKSNQVAALQQTLAAEIADNAAKDARIKELGDERYKLAYAITGGEDAPGYLDSLSVETLVEVARDNARRWFAEIDRAQALEAKLAAAEKALEQLRSDCQTPIDMYERNGPEFTSPHGNEHESTSYVMAKFAELVASIDEARAVLGGKPS